MVPHVAWIMCHGVADDIHVGSFSAVRHGFLSIQLAIAGIEIELLVLQVW